MKHYRSMIVGLVSIMFAAGSLIAQTPPPAVTPAGASAASAGGSGIKAYKDVITAAAKSDDGLFTVHRIDEKLFYEIPTKLLGTEMLLVTRIAKTPRIGYGGENVDQFGNAQVVKWERKFNRILLRTVQYVNVAADSLPVRRALQNANFEEIIASFPIQALGKDSTSVIVDVSTMFTTDIGILTIRKPLRDQYRITALDASRSYIDYAKSFPENIEVENVMTYSADNPPQNAASRTATFTMHHSMVKLPEKPMQPRLADWRVDYFSIAKTDYGSNEHKAYNKEYILRWRLEPKDPAAFARGELVEPVKPITYYIDPATPMKWRPYFKKGIESWNAAFETVGFKNAVRCLEPPTAKEDPDFSPEDVRYSVIRYYPSPIVNAYGPNIHDPRTGEILESDIGWYHNIMDGIGKWYFAQAVADPRTARYPLPDSLMGELVAYVMAHEFGHTLGFPHNHKASNSYPVDSLRSTTFTRKYGISPSIMDYSRFNYVAQPGDNVEMITTIGPYDKFALRWGYRPIQGAATPEAERDTLNKWINDAQKDKMLRFGAQQFLRIVDPTSQSEDIGDDPVKAAQYGTKNLERVMNRLMQAAARPGEPYDELQELYSGPFGAIGQWRLEMQHIANVPGGVDIVRKVNGQEGAVYAPVSRAKQKEAVKYLVDNVFIAPKMFIRPDIVSRFEPSGSVKRLMDAQGGILRTALANDKLLRLLDQEGLAKVPTAQASSQAAYTVLELYNDVENGLFAEAKQSKVQIDEYRRALQREYVKELGNKLVPPKPAVLPPGFPPEFAALLTPPDVSNTDVRAITRAQLERLQSVLKAAVGKSSGDAVTQAHVKDLVVTIEETLNPKK